MGLLARTVSVCFTYKILTDCFPIRHTILRSHQQCMRGVDAVHPHQHLSILVLFLILAILISMQRYLIVDLVYIFLMTNDVEHEALCLYLKFSYNVHVFLFVYLLHLLFNSFKKHLDGVQQWFSKCGSHTSSISTTCKLMENAGFQVPPQTY